MIDLGNENKLDRKQEMTVLTRILAVGVRDYLAFEQGRTQASTNHEKADHAQALTRAPKNPAPAADAREAWGIARNSWTSSYLDNFALQSTIKQRLNQLQQVRDNEGQQLALLESLHLDVQKYFDARLRLAECLEFAEGAQVARDSRLATRSQIEALEKDGLLQGEVKRLQSAPIGRGEWKRLDFLARDWDAQGKYFWMKQQIDLQTGASAKKQ
jgi:hypothetical protein